MTNPFLTESNIKVRLKLSGTIPFFYEQDGKVNIYPEPLKQLLPILSPQGAILLLHISCHLRYNQDWLKLDKDVFMAETDKGRDFFYKAVQDLQDNGIIANRRKGTYWINPLVIFRGSRVKYAQENKIINITK